MPMPRLGTSTDRRTLQHVAEVFNESTNAVLICFVCGCKHINHSCYDMFGNPAEKGRIIFYKNAAFTLQYVDTAV